MFPNLVKILRMDRCPRKIRKEQKGIRFLISMVWNIMSSKNKKLHYKSFSFFSGEGNDVCAKSDWWKIQLGKYLK
jgi:hypothetical protein